MQISQIEQAKYILTALQGDFQAFQWRNHGGLDLDAQYIWWSSENALPAGQLALNFGRIKDPVIDQALADEPGRDRPGEEEGARRDGQQGVRDPVLQHLGRLRPLGSAAHAGRAGPRGLHRSRPATRSASATASPASSTSSRSGSSSSSTRCTAGVSLETPAVSRPDRFTGLQCARIDTVATAVVGSAWRYMWRGSQAARVVRGGEFSKVGPVATPLWEKNRGRGGSRSSGGRFLATTDNDQTPHRDAAGRSRPRSRPRRRCLRQ